MIPRARIAALAAALAWIAPANASAAAATAGRIDGFESASAWTAVPASGVSLALSSAPGAEGRALRADFDFHGGGGYAVIHRDLDLTLPGNYRFTFLVRGECGPENLEFKLIDSTGANVWWCNRRDFAFPRDWQEVVTRRRQITFAWGPAGGGDIRRVAAIEFAITAGSGGSGTVWLDELRVEPLPPPSTVPPPLAGASSSAAGHAAALAADGDTATFWQCASGDRSPRLELDLGMLREFGGLVVDWAPGARARDYDVEASDDGRAWRTLRRVRGGVPVRDWLFLPESEARLVRLRAIGAGAAIGIRDVEVKPLEWSATKAAFFEAVARAAPRGDYPRSIGGEQTFWAVTGADGGADEALLGEDGAIETGKGQWSIEPFLFADGRLYTWADVRARAWLERERLPMPRVGWSADGLELDVWPTMPGSICARYVVRNRGPAARRATLFLAIRPFQVNPPAQFLNLPGGVATVDSIVPEGPLVRVNAGRIVAPLTAPDAFGAATFDQGGVMPHLRAGRVPPDSAARDPFGAASAALAWTLEIPAGGERDVVVNMPLATPTREQLRRFRENLPDPSACRDIERQTADQWAATENRFALSLPDTDLVHTLYAQIGWILVNRDGPAIQPGSRSYERSWMRDGSLTSSALLRTGHAPEVRQFLEWFANHQYADGKVPCCVDARGADPVPEHDSHGEFIWLAAEYFRYTGDAETVRRLWPHVRAAAAYLDTLRAQRRTAEWRTSANAPFFGLLPPSISHEGYSAKPMHSYWDDLFALRGYRDAAWLADTLGEGGDRAWLAASRDTFARDLAASVRAALAAQHIDFVPGCADLGDFDATSTTIALSPVQAEDVLPRAALERTFEKYWENFTARRDGRETWEAFTPYEIRNVGAFARLGWRDRASALLRYFLEYRRPPAWRQWPEVVWHDERTPHFLGDLPHTWVGSDFVRSVLDLLVYERDRDRALVLAAGAPAAWLDSGGIAIERLGTSYGPLAYSLKREGRAVEARIPAGIRVPPGGIVLAPPLEPSTAKSATVNGRRVATAADGSVVVRELPAVVRWEAAGAAKR